MSPSTTKLVANRKHDYPRRAKFLIDRRDSTEGKIPSLLLSRAIVLDRAIMIDQFFENLSSIPSIPAICSRRRKK